MFQLRLVWCFLMSTQVLRALGEKPQRWNAIFIESYQEFLISTWFLSVEADRNHLTEIVFVRFRQCQVPFFFFYLFLHFILGDKILRTDHTEPVGHFASFPRGQSIYVTGFGILLRATSICASLFIIWLYFCHNDLLVFAFVCLAIESCLLQRMR